MEDTPIIYNGIVDIERNPFSSYKSWREEHSAGNSKGSGKIMQPTAITNFQKILEKGGRINDIKDDHTEKYPVFQAIRWGYAVIEGDRVIPTSEWDIISKTISKIEKTNRIETNKSGSSVKQKMNFANITNMNIDNATLEAIYWWNRDEYYYHKYFSQLDKIHKNKITLDFFTTKVFKVFLREYSIRRNLSAGGNSVSSFIQELFENNFVEEVLKGRTEIIDELSAKIKTSGKSTKRNTRSLLSKVAFLINPQQFSLYDSLAKESIWAIHKDFKQFKISELSTYSGFLKQSKNLRDFITDNNLFKNAPLILSEFSETEAFKFFSVNNEAFEMRIVDKFLWLYDQPLNRYNNQGYRELIKLDKLLK